MGMFRQSSQGGFGARRRDRGSSFGNRDRGFERRGGGFGRSGGFGRERDSGRSERPLEKFKVICDKCKKECEVPFKPTQGKPVLCRECFDKTRPISIAADKIDEINEKLDKIIQALEK